MWKTFKELSNTSTQVPPRLILHDGKLVTSIKKIQKIRNSFPTTNGVTPLEILEFLIPKTNKKFCIQMAKIGDIERILKKMKPKKSKGNDIINMQIIKKLCPAIIPHITHLVNSILHTEVYPTIFKVSRITPILKPDKRSELIDSYRPINNLSAIEKVVEQFIKEQLSNYINENNFILPDHHGSRKDFSTMTAISAINSL